jgi:cell division protein FtsB
MARTTSTQRGASRRTTPTATSGKGRSGASSTRSRKSAAPSRKSAPPSRGRSTSTRVQRPSGPIVPIAIIGVLFLLVWSLYPALKLQYQASRSLAGVEQESAALQAHNAALRAQVAALKTPEGVAKAAREALGYAKKGDHAYVVVPSGQATSGAGAVTASVADTSGAPLLQQILDALFGVQQPTSTVEP